MTHTKSLGDRGERLAEDYLKARGYKILDRNFRVKLGEIDLVARDRDCVCFIEVKTRASFEVPQEAVSRLKQRKLTRMAYAYLKAKFDRVDVKARFDVVAVCETASGTDILLIQDAFEAL
jgi:putative endonuclease